MIYHDIPIMLGALDSWELLTSARRRRPWTEAPGSVVPKNWEFLLWGDVLPYNNHEFNWFQPLNRGLYKHFQTSFPCLSFVYRFGRIWAPSGHSLHETQWPFRTDTVPKNWGGGVWRSFHATSTKPGSLHWAVLQMIHMDPHGEYKTNEKQKPPVAKNPWNP